MKPLIINLQIIVYPDGTVSVNNGTATAQPCASGVASLSTGAQASLPSAPPSNEQATSTPPAGPPASGGDGPSESDVRTALLAAVKASDKATAVGVLESIANVSRVPEVSAELRAAVIEKLNEIVANAKPAEA